ncbi:MAG: hypothetical protein JNM80_02045 [Phycisphaerae bacterium]|nr:hypothetical protein [Phycisphaerae bacterium]
MLSISAGLLHSLAIRDGNSTDKYKVIGWGFNGDGQAAVPTNLKAKVVSAGETTSAAIDLEGNLVAWGALSNTGATGLKFHTVAMGNTFGIAQQTDGTLFAWGSDSLGQPVYKANVTHASEVFVSVYAGDSHWIAVRPTGEVICEGYNEDGQNSVPSGTFHSVSTGDWHCFAWRTPMNTGSGGELEVWGRNDEGQGQLPSSGGPYSVAEGGWLHNAAIEGPRVCYANCDGSRVLPILDANDFACFSARFVAGDPYANCDGSTTPPLLTVNDYICFANQFACGCEYSDNRSHPCPPEDP